MAHCSGTSLSSSPRSEALRDVSGAHFNPAVTLAVRASGRTPAEETRDTGRAESETRSSSTCCKELSSSRAGSDVADLRSSNACWGSSVCWDVARVWTCPTDFVTCLVPRLWDLLHHRPGSDAGQHRGFVQGSLFGGPGSNACSCHFGNGTSDRSCRRRQHDEHFLSRSSDSEVHAGGNDSAAPIAQEPALKVAGVCHCFALRPRSPLAVADSDWAQLCTSKENPSLRTGNGGRRFWHFLFVLRRSLCMFASWYMPRTKNLKAICCPSGRPWQQRNFSSGWRKVTGLACTMICVGARLWFGAGQSRTTCLDWRDPNASTYYHRKSVECTRSSNGLRPGSQASSFSRTKSQMLLAGTGQLCWQQR